MLMLVWAMLSGKFDLFHLSLGVVSCALITWFSGDLLFPDGLPRGIFGTWMRLALYIPWLIWQTWLSSIHILRLVFRPDLMDHIDPHLITFESRLENETARVTFANSITLTPGTITASLTALGKFTVHAIDHDSSAPLPGDMQDRVARIYGE